MVDVQIERPTTSVTDDAAALADPGVSLERGVAALRAALAAMPAGPGVYCMRDRHEKPLYVGKAKSLRKRVQTYVNVRTLPVRLQRMIAGTASVEVITTEGEVEALLLESNMIKRLKPHYNILLRDDKSFPYILLRRDHAWPQIAKYRGARSAGGDYFGPFASAGAVNLTINALQRAFPLRSCSDSVLESRTRPCLQYQIKRCTAPCVGRIAKADYDGLVDEARAFLAGRSREVQRRLTERMTAASDALEFETAAAFRDRIKALAHIQMRQGINLPSMGDADVVAIHDEAGQACVQVFFFRAGQNYGNRAFFPRHGADDPAEAILGAFIGQFYSAREAPPLVLVNRPLGEAKLIAEALSVKAGRRVRLHRPLRGAKRKLLEDAERNAREALARRLGESTAQRRLLESLAERFGLESAPRRIEVYDNSHISGTDAVGSLIVAGAGGLHQERLPQVHDPLDDGDPGGGPGGGRPGGARRRLRHDARGADAALLPPHQGGPRARRRGVARPGADRRRRRPARRGAARLRRPRHRRPRGGGDRQGAGAQRRARARLPARPAARRARRARPAALLPAAPARRGPPLRHRHPPRQAGQGPRPLGAGRDSGRGPPPQEGAAPPLRLGAGGEPGGPRRPRDRGRHIEHGGARDP